MLAMATGKMWAASVVVAMYQTSSQSHARAGNYQVCYVMNDEEDDCLRLRTSTFGVLCPSLESILKKDIECLEKVQTRATKLVK